MFLNNLAGLLKDSVPSLIDSRTIFQDSCRILFAGGRHRFPVGDGTNVARILSGVSRILSGFVAVASVSDQVSRIAAGSLKSSQGSSGDSDGLFAIFCHSSINPLGSSHTNSGIFQSCHQSFSRSFGIIKDSLGYTKDSWRNQILSLPFSRIFF